MTAVTAMPIRIVKRACVEKTLCRTDSNFDATNPRMILTMYVKAIKMKINAMTMERIVQYRLLQRSRHPLKHPML